MTIRFHIMQSFVMNSLGNLTAESVDLLKWVIDVICIARETLVVTPGMQRDSNEFFGSVGNSLRITFESKVRKYLAEVMTKGIMQQDFAIKGAFNISEIKAQLEHFIDEVRLPTGQNRRDQIGSILSCIGAAYAGHGEKMIGAILRTRMPPDDINSTVIKSLTFLKHASYSYAHAFNLFLLDDDRCHTYALMALLHGTRSAAFTWHTCYEFRRAMEASENAAAPFFGRMATSYENERRIVADAFASAEKMRREMRACGAYESYGEADAAFFAMPAFCCSLPDLKLLVTGGNSLNAVELVIFSCWCVTACQALRPFLAATISMFTDLLLNPALQRKGECRRDRHFNRDYQVRAEG